MFKFYRNVIVSAVAEFWGATDKILAGVTVVLFFVGLFNKKWADQLVNTWEGVSQWWSVLPIGLFAGYRLLRSNYEHFQKLSDGFEKTTKDLEASNKTLRAEINRLKAIPPKIEVSLVELRRRPANGGRDRNDAGEMSFDVFALIRLDLESPASAQILKYALQLSSHGKTASLDSRQDAAEWEIDFWTPQKTTAIDLQELPKDIKSGEPAEGWLHFVVGPIHLKSLENAKIRLLAVTEQKSYFAEKNSGPGNWTSNPEQTIARKGWTKT